MFSVCEELAIANDTIGKLRAKVNTGRNKMDYNQQLAGVQYSRAVDERLNSEFSYHREVFAWNKCLRDLKLNLSAAVDSETQTRE